VRADRLLSLALLLQARGRMSAHDLASALEVSVRTVYRDIAALNAAGVPVLAEPGPNGGCALIEGYRFPLRGLSPDEAEALLALGAPGVAADLGLADVLDSAQHKVRTSAGAAGQPALVHLDLPRWFHGTEPVPHLPALAAAVRRGQAVQLGYRRDGGEAAPRAVGPLGLVNKAGTWYLIATRDGGAGDPGGAPAVFRVGRVTAVRTLPAPVTRPAGFDLAAFWDQWSAEFEASRPQIRVLAWATPLALGIFPYVFGDAGRRAAADAGPAGPDGRREVTLTFEEEPAAVHRLAGFGGEVEVTEPASVRGGLIETAAALLARYGPA
jgi:predicted DNA-binding transcriptional regulator YafY